MSSVTGTHGKMNWTFSKMSGIYDEEFYKDNQPEEYVCGGTLI